MLHLVSTVPSQYSKHLKTGLESKALFTHGINVHNWITNTVLSTGVNGVKSVLRTHCGSIPQTIFGGDLGSIWPITFVVCTRMCLSVSKTATKDHLINCFIILAGKYVIIARLFGKCAKQYSSLPLG